MCKERSQVSRKLSRKTRIRISFSKPQRRITAKCFLRKGSCLKTRNYRTKSRGWDHGWEPPPEHRNPLLGLFSACFTFFIFTTTCFMAPFIFTLFLGVKIARWCWLWFLESRFPELEFVRSITPRTAVDTMRNQGIITLLLKLDSPSDIQALRKAIQEEVVNKKRTESSGGDHLRRVLTSRWGRYAWVKGSERRFKLEAHVLSGVNSFKGRPLTEANIQDYVSDVVSKLLAPDSPPWQVISINTQSGGSYLLIRLHHLYLSEDNLSLGDVLMLKRGQLGCCVDDEAHTLLRSMFSPPVVISQVKEQVAEGLSNHCNELLSEYEDPVKVAKKNSPSISLLLSLIAVTCITTWKQPQNGGLWKEASRHGLTATFALECLINSLSPVKVFMTWITFWWKLFILLPVILVGFVKDTPVYLYWLYLGHYVLQEIVYLAGIIYSTPRILVEEILLPEHPKNVHSLQTLSLCGRKVVSWSEPIPRELIDQLSQATGSSSSEILLSATSNCLRIYFEEAGLSVPESLMTSCRVVGGESFLGRGESGGGGDSGVLCLPLPLGSATPSIPLASLGCLRTALTSSRPRQAPLYLASQLGLLTRLFPSLLARACLYLLSRRYTVGVTLVSTGRPAPRHLIWGPRLQSVMYWRPPQANACLSLTVMCYGGEVQLGVMSDAQLSPQHSVITKSFPANVQSLAKAVGI